MKSQPPHLPKKSTKDDAERIRRSLFYFISFTLICVAASLATVFVALSWVVPRAVPEVRFYTFEQSRPETVPTALDGGVLDRLTEREVQLFDRADAQIEGWYPVGSRLARGVFLTSDGWAVFEWSPKNGIPKNLEILDSRGLSYGVEETYHDQNLGLLYIKVGGDGFRFSNFAAWDVLSSDTALFAKRDSVYEPVTFGSAEKNLEVGAMWEPLFVKKSRSEVTPGPVFTVHGDMAGFVTADQVFIPGWYVDNTLFSLLSRGTLSLSAFSFEGELIEVRLPEISSGKLTFGFFVEKAVQSNDEESVKAGDVIVKIAGSTFTPESLSRLVLETPETVELQIIRDGQIIERTVQKETLSLD